MSKLNEFKLAKIRITYRHRKHADERQQVSSSKEAYNLFMNNWDKGLINMQEEFKAIFFDRAHRALGIFEVSKGGVSGTVVDPKILFSSALLSLASATILAHNHPSQNSKPSSADIKLTNNLCKGGELLGIKVLDHLIITDTHYFSMADEGLIHYNGVPTSSCWEGEYHYNPPALEI